MTTETKSNLAKMKQSDRSSKGKFDAATNRKKLESSSKQPIDSKQKSLSTVTTKTEVKSKTSSTSSKSSTITKTKVREKKVYTLAGQKHDRPEEREPLRIFYESLSKQIPTSEMAEFWMMEHGLLSPEKARKAHEKKQRRQKQLRAGKPIKPLKTSGKPESSKKQQPASRNGDVKAKKRISNDMDDDFILSPKRRKGVVCQEPMDPLTCPILSPFRFCRDPSRRGSQRGSVSRCHVSQTSWKWYAFVHEGHIRTHSIAEITF